ncbi:transcription elongation factor GreA [Candidatus Berkelbacteria bacterium RIFCSPHIGHO2_12_FULL_36_9]|uniref:Transcription elongation factor GreA n=1 Tax=Candidatus Berkelbacteria bacterium RIFCSPHIGHO2_12_FULL_36_9 TaxID=1797469 RepID=A0A1F5EIY9_9BACT|nr:MAG: transcription elongation factor GreA [Candidatus Berkelbacteria bacterium RIFCSPHIGHO2_12_FULL_36_9]
MLEEIILTKDGLEKLKKELEDLKKNKRPVVIQRIKTAKEFGDLSENAEYEDAKNEQSFIEGKIEELEATLKRAKIISELHDTSQVSIGDKVCVDCNGKKTCYKIVGSTESDPENGKISSESPIAVSLLGKKKGETVMVSVPDGEMKCKILDIK